MVKTIEIRGQGGVAKLSIPEGTSPEKALGLFCFYITLAEGKIKPEHIAKLLGTRIALVWSAIRESKEKVGVLNSDAVSGVIRNSLFSMSLLPDRNNQDLFAAGFFRAVNELAILMVKALEKRCRNLKDDCFLKGNCPGDCFPF